MDEMMQRARAFENQWTDPDSDGLGIADFITYPQPSRCSSGVGSAFVYLPPNYEAEATRRFPVLYWLHGGFAHSHQGLPGIERIDAAIKAGKMPAMIVVAPQALPIGWYVDSKDGARPIGQIIAHDLVAFIDSTYRTQAHAQGRSIEGFSMGGYGALHLGLKHPHVFGAISAIGPSILRDISLEPPARTDNTFFGDPEYYAAVSPWSLALANSPEVRAVSRIRVLGGADDGRLATEIRAFTQVLDALRIPHEFHEIPDVAHDYLAIMDALGDEYFSFWLHGEHRA